MYAVRLLGRGAYKHEIISLIKKRFSSPHEGKDLSSRTCENILARAREELTARTGRSRDEHREESVAFWESIIRDPDASLAEMMHARTRLEVLLGLQAPLEHRHGQSDSAGPVQQVREVVVRTRQEASAFLAQQEAENLKRLEDRRNQ